MKRQVLSILVENTAGSNKPYFGAVQPPKDITLTVFHPVLRLIRGLQGLQL